MLEIRETQTKLLKKLKLDFCIQYKFPNSYVCKIWFLYSLNIFIYLIFLII